MVKPSRGGALLALKRFRDGDDVAEWGEGDLPAMVRVEPLPLPVRRGSEVFPLDVMSWKERWFRGTGKRPTKA